MVKPITPEEQQENIFPNPEVFLEQNQIREETRRALQELAQEVELQEA